MEFIYWIGLSILFFLVSYLAVVNLLEDLIEKKILKFFVIIFISILMGFLIAIFNYQPIFMIAVASITNYYRVMHKTKTTKGYNKKTYLINHFMISYLYLFLLCVFGYYFQSPIEIDGNFTPYWKTLFSAK